MSRSEVTQIAWPASSAARFRWSSRFAEDWKGGSGPFRDIHSIALPLRAWKLPNESKGVLSICSASFRCETGSDKGSVSCRQIWKVFFCPNRSSAPFTRYKSWVSRYPEIASVAPPTTCTTVINSTVTRHDTNAGWRRSKHRCARRWTILNRQEMALDGCRHQLGHRQRVRRARRYDPARAHHPGRAQDVYRRDAMAEY